jgi:amino-acid N-acetyltransferase
VNITGLVISHAISEDYSEISSLLERVSLSIDGVDVIIPDMLVLKERDRIVGCAGLERYGTSALLRSVGVDVKLQRSGYGSALVSAILDLARERGIKELYLLTETAPTFFEKYGFQTIDRGDFPESVKKSREFTIICPQSAVAMKLSLT